MLHIRICAGGQVTVIPTATHIHALLPFSMLFKYETAHLTPWVARDNLAACPQTE